MRDPLREKHIEVQRLLLDLVAVAAREAISALQSNAEIPASVARVLDNFAPKIEAKTFLAYDGDQWNGRPPPIGGYLAVETREKLNRVDAQGALLGTLGAATSDERKMIDVSPSEEDELRRAMQ